MGFTRPEETVGKLLYNGNQSYPVVGVVADFYENSFHEAMRPVVIGRTPGREWSLAFKLNAGVKESAAVKEILSATESAWKKVFPDRGMNYSFLNESITRLYDQDKKIAWLMNVAMIITIFISCMGLFGLGMFTAQKRTKEISIRKVLGARVITIMAMLSKDFVVLVLIALLIASPVAYYFMHQWLLDFAYRIDINWWVFVLAGAAAILIALITVSIHAIKAAIANPVKSLRAE
jgi:ABC-type antimicrobial peptide transport system permease subunit